MSLLYLYVSNSSINNVFYLNRINRLVSSTEMQCDFCVTGTGLLHFIQVKIRLHIPIHMANWIFKQIFQILCVISWHFPPFDWYVKAFICLSLRDDSPSPPPHLVTISWRALISTFPQFISLLGVHILTLSFSLCIQGKMFCEVFRILDEL